MATELKHLRVIVAAADCGSFSSAALQLNTDISAVSRAVREIEDTLGAAVFERLPRGVRLTLAGEAYVAAARDILARMGRAELEARSAAVQGAGALTMGCVWSYSCAPKVDLLRRFMSANPRTLLTLVEDGQEALLARVRSGELHVALIAAEPSPFPPLRTQTDLESVTLWRERLVVAVPEADAVDALGWGDLAGRVLLCRPQDDWRRFVAHVERLGGPTLQFMEQDVSEEGLLALVGAGLGWSIVPGSLPAPDFAMARFVSLTEPGAELDIQAVWRPGATNPALSRFLDLCRSVQSDGLSQTPDPSP